jgi:hypothetical protein
VEKGGRGLQERRWELGVRGSLAIESCWDLPFSGEDEGQEGWRGMDQAGVC